MRILAVLALTGATGCSVIATDEAMCGALRVPVTELRAGLESNLEATPDAVGEPATDVVIITEAGCGK
ncbi:hypothetical protein ROJ8625_04081 [Roseivivax jejudonensis]|uniref:Uncharacterized protein n=1 Tax=Roseivivax jejudonensis TaxID=1529041 RepID=A0A1X7AD79_9RHOB|nr:hypothetical protein ROJ8625_04081 [Roseivivax jejudonensis]